MSACTTNNPSVHQSPGLRRLLAFGLDAPWKVPLFLPASYLDCSSVRVAAATLDKKAKRAIELQVTGTPTYGTRSGPPRMTFPVRDATGEIYRASVYGDGALWRDRLCQDAPQLFLATGHEFSGVFRLTLHDILPGKYAGRVIPQYPAPRAQIDPEVLRALVAAELPRALADAAMHVQSQLEAIAPLELLMEMLGAGSWTLPQLLQQAHYPQDMALVGPVVATLKRLAAIGSLAAASNEATRGGSNPIKLPTVAVRSQAMPFTLTEDQQRAIHDIADDVGRESGTAMRIVCGDCGVGKTAVAGVICAAFADAGRRCMVLFPSTVVAGQAHAEFRRWFPDLEVGLVTGQSTDPVTTTAHILMGTSALLHRDVGEMDLIIVDEQHRFAVGQRERHRGPRTHVVELSATCIPRTQALVRFGHAQVSEMRQTHKEKFIESSLHIGREDARRLMDELLFIVRGGNPVFVIYPKREADPSGSDKLNIQSAAKLWESIFPGWVTTLTGDDDDTAKDAALKSIGDGSKRILCSTTVVEVGVDVRNLRHIVIVEPQRYGLVQLHQLRGRVARAGGEGWCYLLAPNGMPAASRQRMDTFLSTTDGFVLAEADLVQRGAGDLSPGSTRQHGADGNFLHGAKIDLEIYDQVAPLLAQIKSTRMP